MPGPALTIKDGFPAQTEAWESVNVPDVYFRPARSAQARDFKVHQRIHPASRYDMQALHHILEQRYHDRPGRRRDRRPRRWPTP